MSEIAVGGPQATDVFSLGGSFEVQNSSVDSQATLDQVVDDVGDVVASNLRNEMDSVSATYVYISTDVALTAVSGDALVMPRPGELHNNYTVTSVQVVYAQNSMPVVTVTGHNHDDNAHDADLAIFSPSVELTYGFGVPDILTNGAATSACTGATYTIECEHVDIENNDGDHFAGASMKGKESLSLSYVGTPSLTDTGWYLTSSNANDSNSEFDTVSKSYEKPVARDA